MDYVFDQTWQNLLECAIVLDSGNKWAQKPIFLFSYRCRLCSCSSEGIFKSIFRLFGLINRKIGRGPHHLLGRIGRLTQRTHPRFVSIHSLKRRKKYVHEWGKHPFDNMIDIVVTKRYFVWTRRVTKDLLSLFNALLIMHHASIKYFLF